MMKPAAHFRVAGILFFGHGWCVCKWLVFSFFRWLVCFFFFVACLFSARPRRAPARAILLFSFCFLFFFSKSHYIHLRERPTPPLGRAPAERFSKKKYLFSFFLLLSLFFFLNQTRLNPAEAPKLWRRDRLIRRERRRLKLSAGALSPISTTAGAPNSLSSERHGALEKVQ